MAKNSVLVVEDSEIDQHIIQYVIQEFDPELEILQAFDGQEALEILKSLTNQPLWIFLDINMPRMNGHEFLKEYQNSQLEKTSVVMVTSSLQEEDKNQCLQYQCVKHYLPKPLDLADVITVLSTNDSD